MLNLYQTTKFLDWSKLKQIADDNLNCIKPFPKQALVFTCLQYRYFENTVGKREIAPNDQFLLFPNCFPLVLRNFCHFHQI